VILDLPLAAQPPLWGTVLAVQANYYRVRLASADWPVSELLCIRRSRLKKTGQQVMVGDQVGIEEPDWAGQRGAIAQVLPRQTRLGRPPVANANQLLLVFALAEPDLDPYQLSRFLVTAESTDLEVALCLSKQDLVEPAQCQSWCDRIKQWGYRPILVSLALEQGLTVLAQQLQNKLTVISGPSGVGKSSLINYLIPSLNLSTGAVSDRGGKGRHTTRHVELFELTAGGLLADTPGFNQPALLGSAVELAACFPEIGQRLAQASCQFNNCLHRDEPDCAVRGDWERYPHYLEFLAEIQTREMQQLEMGGSESALKRKSGDRGQTSYEPKLELKKYRRSSRRRQQQDLQSLVDEAGED
jgi:ribosome biogenesis GTPase / thiamine phosphate phosphatase